MNQSIPARRRAALHAIRLAAMRLDKDVPAEVFAKEIEDLMEAVRQETLEQSLARMSTAAEMRDVVSAAELKEKTAPFEPDWPRPSASSDAPLHGGLGLTPAPLNSPTVTTRRGGIPKLTDEQVAKLSEQYREVMKGRERTPVGWTRSRAVELGVSIATIYNALNGAMAEMFAEQNGPRPRVREVEGKYGTTGRQERGAL